ncbi:hypothetical protein GGR58DRAFT_506849 [Xylaria digitata]|nr:hypothetical protein GGR58DRAFT_506849 [Xylaria digitata]
MRIAFLLSALSALSTITTSSAVPRNDSVDGSVVDYHQDTPSTNVHHVPITRTDCTGYPLDKEDYIAAKNNMVSWSNNGGKIRYKSYHKEMYPKDTINSGVTWYVCNCKWFYRDKVPQWEIDDVERALTKKCGELQSGSVWSKKWRKAFNVVPTAWFADAIVHEKPVCPSHCLLYGQ